MKITRALLGLVAASALTPAVATADEIRLTGTIRDFRQTHVDFEVQPFGGYGHYVGNVRADPLEDGRPAFSSWGVRVRREWTDASDRPIAPQLYTPSGTDACGNPINDHIGAPGVVSRGGIDSSASFNEWFRDIPGVNQSTAHTITLTRDGAGVFAYLDDDFHPIDDRLLGNEGADHNDYFTYEIHATFEYRQCWAQFIEFEGGDGTWMFINGRLVVDLGGVDTGTLQRVDLDRLGLEDGESCTIDLFHAQRHSTLSVFRLRTTLALTTLGPLPSVSAMFD